MQHNTEKKINTAETTASVRLFIVDLSPFQIKNYAGLALFVKVAQKDGRRVGPIDDQSADSWRFCRLPRPYAHPARENPAGTQGFRGIKPLRYE
jgi:hypothetical protein